MNNDLISRDALKKDIDFQFICECCHNNGNTCDICPVAEIEKKIDDAPTVESVAQGRCKTCKYYHPYLEQFSNEARGDGCCVIARMTPEGMTTINCNDEFGCLDYQKDGTE